MSKIFPDDLQQRIYGTMNRAGVNEETAQYVAHHLTMAEIQGQSGHGLLRVKSYRAQAISGKVNNNAKITHETHGACMAIDADHGFAFGAIETAIKQAPELAKSQGTCLITIKNSHHAGVLGLHAERFAEQGLIALMMSNSPAAMAAWGGKTPVFGTNPIAFACPQKDNAPLVIDLSLSHVARGKIMRAYQDGKDIPEGWGIDKDGNPSTNAKEVLDGSLLPAGGVKGAMLALIVEILCAGLSGANFSFDASSFFDADGDAPSVGQAILLFAPPNPDVFLQRIDHLLSVMCADDGVRLPGAKRLKMREDAHENGIEVHDDMLKSLES